MNWEGHVPLLICYERLLDYRAKPLRVPATREELAALHVRLSWTYIGVALGCNGPDEQQFLDWYKAHEKAIDRVERRFDRKPVM